MIDVIRTTGMTHVALVFKKAVLNLKTFRTSLINAYVDLSSMSFGDLIIQFVVSQTDPILK